jgi:hypothetical protein
MDVQTGVDDLWIADSRIALKEMIRMGPMNVADAAARAAAYADAMRHERAVRGGRRDSNDPREMLALVQENIPAFLSLMEGIGAALSRKKSQRE